MIYLILSTLIFLLCLTGYLYYQLSCITKMVKEMARLATEDHQTSTQIYKIIHDFMEDTTEYLVKNDDYVSDLFKELS